MKLTVRLSNPPAILRHCSKCGRKTSFASSRKFRINAGGKRLDVWLIYRCAVCETTFNMDILSRVNPSEISQDLYRSFQENDAETADRFACRLDILRGNRVEPDPASIHYTYIADDSQAPDRLTIDAAVPGGIRADQAVAQALGLSRSRVRLLFASGAVLPDDDSVAPNAKICGIVHFILRL